MRQVNFAVPTLLAALGLATAAGASVNYNSSKSNTGNFTIECTRQGGKVSTVAGSPACTFGKPGIAVKTTGNGVGLAAACTKDGGKIVRKGGVSTCVISKAADKRTYTSGK